MNTYPLSDSDLIFVPIFQTLVEFLTKEVTHVISEGPEWKFLLVANGTSCGPPSPAPTLSPWTPAATPSPATSTSHDVRHYIPIKSKIEGDVYDD